MSDESTPDGIERNRRRFLKTAAATTAAGFAVTTGSAAARTVTREYADPIAVETALERHGSDVLAALADDGLLARGDVTDLPTRRQTDPGDAGAVRLRHGDGPDEMAVTRGVDDGRLRVAVRPGEGRVYAVHTPAGDGERTVYAQDGSTYQLTDCCKYYWYCTHIREGCDQYCEYVEQYQCPCYEDNILTFDYCGCLC